MKIVMLCDLYDEKLQYQENLLTKYYQKNGHSVTVVAATFDDAFAYYADAYDPKAPRREYMDGATKVIKLPYSLNLLNKLRRFAGVAEILAEEKPDLIFVHDIHLNILEAAQYKRRNPGCRVIMDYHADYTNSAKNWLSLNILHKVIRKSILYRAKSQLDAIYPVVPISAVFLNEVYGIPHSEMSLLPLGADTDLAHAVRQRGEGKRIRERLSIPPDAVVAFTGGKLDPLKETHVLFQAINELTDSRVHLLVVGETRGNPDYAARLEKLSAANPRIHRVGWVDGAEVYDYMDASDLAVFPASQSVLWQQALSMGLPLIVGEGTTVGGQDPSYMNLYDNVVILPRDQITPTHIAHHIRTMVEDSDLLRRRQEGALQTTEDLLNYDKLIAITLGSATPVALPAPSVMR